MEIDLLEDSEGLADPDPNDEEEIVVEDEEGEEVDRDDKLDGHLFSEYLHELTVFELADTQVVLELLETLIRQGKVRN